MSTTTSDLLNRANIIKNETLEGKNSAVRVGSLFWDIISKMEGNTSKLSTLEELINSGGSRYSNVRVTPVYTNGVLIATIRVGVQDYAIYAPGKGGSGSDSDSDGYDDRELRREIDLIKSNLDNILEREKAGIKDMVEEILAGKNFISGWQAGWYETLKSYLISVGVLGADGVSKGWAYLDTKYNDLEAAVNSLRRIGEDNQGLYETLQSRLNLFSQDDVNGLKSAVAELQARYAMTADDQTVLKWLTAQLRVQAGANMSLAELFAAASDLQNQINALAALRLTVEEIAGNYVAKSSLTTKIEDALNNKIYSAGLISESTLGRAMATLFAAEEGTAQSIIAKITAEVKDGISSINLTADQINAIAKAITLKPEQLAIIADNIDIQFKDIRLLDGKGRLYIHSVKDSEENIIKFACEVGDFEIESDGNVRVNEGGICGRYSFTGYYMDAPKIVCSHLMLPDQNNNGESYIDLNSHSVIRWFNHIGANHTTGDEVGYDSVETDGISKGTITFSDKTIIINGNLQVNGTLTHNS